MFYKINFVLSWTYILSKVYRPLVLSVVFVIMPLLAYVFVVRVKNKICIVNIH